MKNKKLYLILGLAVIFVAVMIMVSRIQLKDKQEDNDLLAMYVPFGDGLFLFFDQRNDGAFDASIPDALYDIHGEKITSSDLEEGNIVKISGDGVMAMSDPGQYPGVTRMEVVKEGSPADADKYQEIVKKYYREPDPSEPPTLGLSYTTNLAVVYSVVTGGGYEWNYTDKNGERQSVIADSQPVLMWSDINDITLDNLSDLELEFSEKPLEVKAERWSSSLQGSQEAPLNGEPVEINVDGGKLILKDAEAGYIYHITAIWENGSREFGFLTM